MLRITRCLVLFALVSLICGGLRAQQGQDLSSLAGVVTDASGAVIPGVTVTLKNPLTGVVYTATTNNEGFYRIPGVVPAQTYEVTFTATGFSDARFTDVPLLVASARTQNAQLKAGEAVAIEVSVEGQRNTINTIDATSPSISFVFLSSAPSSYVFVSRFHNRFITRLFLERITSFILPLYSLNSLTSLLIVFSLGHKTINCI